MKTIIVSDQSELVENFSKYFGNIVENLRLHCQSNTSSDNDNVTIWRAIEKHQNHPTIKVIWENFDFTINFCFDLINHECISSYLASSYLVTEQGDIPAKVIKDDKDLFPYFVLRMLWIRAFFQTDYIMQISNQSIKKNQEMKKKIIDL